MSFLMALRPKRAALLRSVRTFSATDETHKRCVAFVKAKRLQPAEEAFALYKNELRMVVKDLFLIDGGSGVREAAILLPMRTGTASRWTTHWVAPHELEDFVQEGSGKDLVVRRLSAD